MSVCVVNVSCGRPGYTQGQTRLNASLDQHGYKGERMYWGDACAKKLPPGSPSHESVPYAFKLHALKAAEEAGHTTLLWADSSMWLTGAIDPIVAHAKQYGVAAWNGGWSVGQWTSDRALTKLEISRDAAMLLPLVVGGLVCINTEHAKGKQLLDEWFRFATDGVSFIGAWDNVGGKVSADSRVLGHRHDMPSLSVIANRLDVELLKCPKWFSYDSDTPDPQSIFLARGI